MDASTDSNSPLSLGAADNPRIDSSTDAQEQSTTSSKGQSLSDIFNNTKVSSDSDLHINRIEGGPSLPHDGDTPPAIENQESTQKNVPGNSKKQANAEPVKTEGSSRKEIVGAIPDQERITKEMETSSNVNVMVQVVDNRESVPNDLVNPPNTEDYIASRTHIENAQQKEENNHQAMNNTENKQTEGHSGIGKEETTDDRGDDLQQFGQRDPSNPHGTSFGSKRSTGDSLDDNKPTEHEQRGGNDTTINGEVKGERVGLESGGFEDKDTNKLQQNPFAESETKTDAVRNSPDNERPSEHGPTLVVGTGINDVSEGGEQFGLGSCIDMESSGAGDKVQENIAKNDTQEHPKNLVSSKEESAKSKPNASDIVMGNVNDRQGAASQAEGEEYSDEEFEDEDNLEPSSESNDAEVVISGKSEVEPSTNAPNVLATEVERDGMLIKSNSVTAHEPQKELITHEMVAPTTKTENEALSVQDQEPMPAIEGKEPETNASNVTMKNDFTKTTSKSQDVMSRSINNEQKDDYSKLSAKDQHSTPSDNMDKSPVQEKYMEDTSTRDQDIVFTSDQEEVANKANASSSREEHKNKRVGNTKGRKKHSIEKVSENTKLKKNKKKKKSVDKSSALTPATPETKKPKQRVNSIGLTAKGDGVVDRKFQRLEKKVLTIEAKLGKGKGGSMLHQANNVSKPKKGVPINSKKPVVAGKRSGETRNTRNSIKNARNSDPNHHRTNHGLDQSRSTTKGSRPSKQTSAIGRESPPTSHHLASKPRMSLVDRHNTAKQKPAVEKPEAKSQRHKQSQGGELNRPPSRSVAPLSPNSSPAPYKHVALPHLGSRTMLGKAPALPVRVSTAQEAAALPLKSYPEYVEMRYAANRDAIFNKRSRKNSPSAGERPKTSPFASSQASVVHELETLQSPQARKKPPGKLSPMHNTKAGFGVRKSIVDIYTHVQTIPKPKRKGRSKIHGLFKDPLELAQDVTGRYLLFDQRINNPPREEGKQPTPKNNAEDNIDEVNAPSSSTSEEKNLENEEENVTGVLDASELITQEKEKSDDDSYDSSSFGDDFEDGESEDDAPIKLVVNVKPKKRVTRRRKRDKAKKKSKKKRKGRRKDWRRHLDKQVMRMSRADADNIAYQCHLRIQALERGDDLI